MGKMRATRLYLKTTREEYDKLRFYRGFVSKFAVPSLDLTPPNHFGFRTEHVLRHLKNIY